MDSNPCDVTIFLKAYLLEDILLNIWFYIWAFLNILIVYEMYFDRLWDQMNYH